jgi:hypothetical protein
MRSFRNILLIDLPGKAVIYINLNGIAMQSRFPKRQAICLVQNSFVFPPSTSAVSWNYFCWQLWTVPIWMLKTDG